MEYLRQLTFVSLVDPKWKIFSFSSSFRINNNTTEVSCGRFLVSCLAETAPATQANKARFDAVLQVITNYDLLCLLDRNEGVIYF